MKTTVVVCVDGFDPEYLDQGIKDGILPTFQSFLTHGYAGHGKSAMPSFTNPNNLSIITGAPTRKRGIGGSYVYDKATRAEEMMLDDSHVTGPTILSKLSVMGKKIVVVTAKDKLRKILRHELAPGSVCFSTEKLDQCSVAEHGIEDVAEWLGAELSIRVLEAGLYMLRKSMGDVFYLTLSDYVQHKNAPGTKESNDFLFKLNSLLKLIVDEGAVIGVTGDHGMSDKCMPSGDLNVLYLQDKLDQTYGEGSFICPITDPFVLHHGALGSFVRVYMYTDAPIAEVLALVKSQDQVEYAAEGAEAAEMLEMPIKNEGCCCGQKERSDWVSSL